MLKYLYIQKIRRISEGEDYIISEKELEENLLKQLLDQGYEIVDVKDEESLLENFRKQLEKFNNIKFSNEEFTKILTHLAVGSIFEKFKKDFIKEVRKYNAKTSVDFVRMEMITNMLISLPCLEEQEKIANFLSSIDNKIDNLTSELEDLKEFKKGLLQQMLV